MRILLELLRIVIVFVLLGSLGSVILKYFYTIYRIPEGFFWQGSMAILLLLFVLYRNKLQFLGWYVGKGRGKLSKVVTLTLIIISVLLILFPFFLN